ncbi:BnaCnng10750D [Brassica napus]|uniref:BnaCnng10750D protein n=1 Tax=Brassica napus TaxID=3708 RepID=A0A078I0J8_BRANA|nr:BnaCnng10750D [Brassica napus]
MWGKGKRLEIHNNPLQCSALVRIPSEFLRQEILYKNIWYVGDSMFHTAQWSSEHSSSTPRSQRHKDLGSPNGLALTDPTNVCILSQSIQMIICEVDFPNFPPIIYSAIYASNLSEKRTDLWVELLNVHTALALDTKHWMIGGEFNQILNSYEHSSFCHSSHSYQMYQFRESLFHEILTSFPNATATFLPLVPSDHSPCLIDLAFQFPKNGTQPFRFLNYLTKYPSFLEVISDAWFLTGSVSVKLASLCWKMKSIKRSLKILNKENFSNIQHKVKETYGLLQLAQVHALMDPTTQSFLREGDLNTTYFHRVCQVRASYNAIQSYLLLSGAIITDPLEMSALAISNFKAVLGPVQLPRVWFSPLDWFQGLTPFKCSLQQKGIILLMPTSDEIMKIMFSLNPNKAPGPGGLTSGFFKASWSLLGKDCAISIQKFFNTGFLPKTTNSTILSLEPKFTGVSKIS